jgi:Xaa-Pro dipeptidase
MRIDDCSHMLERLRSVKSVAELAYVQSAAAIVTKAMRAGIEAVSEGAPEPDVAAAVYQDLLRGGSEFIANPPFVSSGWKTGLGHSTWGKKLIERGDNVYFELVACQARYHVPLMRTVYVGTPGELGRKIAQTSLAAVEAALKVIKEGVAAEDIDAAARGEIARRKMSDVFRHRSGYSVGVAYPPGWPEGGLLSLRPGNKEIIRENMVLHLPLVLLGHGEAGAGFSETVLVKKDGCEILTAACERSFLKI